jgi:hypothetical protein
MFLLKEYIRYLVRKTLNEQGLPASLPPPPSPGGGGGISPTPSPPPLSTRPYTGSGRPPRLPRIRSSIGSGAIPKEGGAVNEDRVKFGNAALQVMQSYINQLNTSRRFDPITARNLNSVSQQIMDQLNNDTNNWSDINEDLEETLRELQPEDSALQKIIDYTDWGNTTAPDNATLNLYFREISTEAMPKVIAALQAYVENYS